MSRDQTVVSGADALTLVSADVPRDLTDALVDALAGHELAAATWEDAESPACRIQLFLRDADAASVAVDTLVRLGHAFGLALLPTVEVLPRQDWAESWKRFFHVSRISRRVVVRPPWEAYEPAGGECVIVLDPGMSFGTGRHGTTQACLQFLDALALEDPHRSMLDVGCGSGILAIAACKLGFSPVRGIDHDGDAVRIARENAAVNGVTPIFETGDLADCPLRAEVVAANVLAPVLIEHAARICGTVAPRPGAALLLSGILDGQYAAVRDAYARHGFLERESLLIGEWRSGWFARES